MGLGGAESGAQAPPLQGRPVITGTQDTQQGKKGRAKGGRSDGV